MKAKLLAMNVVATLAFAFNLNAQDDMRPVCGTQMPDENWEKWFQTKIKEYETKVAEGKTTQTTYIIPVIAHIIHASSEAQGVGSNLKAQQVQAQIDALNDAMAGNAPGNSNIPSVFANVDAGNTNIVFCLATKDKNGNPMAEPGIDRIDWGAKGWQNPANLGNNVQSYFDGTVKPASIWDPTKYFNIWVGDFLNSSGSGLIGYATFPSGTGLSGIPGGTGTSTTDGVVMASKCFGCKAKFANGYYSQAAYAQGITTVHEVGHWLGLRHISGDATCGNDYCNDTPPQKGGNNGCQNGLNWGCPSHPFQANQCSGNANGEMFMNFMDYSDDGCRSLFTANQATRMFTAINNGTYRTPLLTSGVCSSGPLANFVANKTIVCPGMPITFTDQSGNSPTTWHWTFTGGNPSTSTNQNPTVTYSAPGTYNVKLVVTNNNGADSTVKTSYITVSAINALPLVEGFQAATFPPANWATVNANNDTAFWKRCAYTGGFATSSACMMMDNYNNDNLGVYDEMLTPKYNFANLSSAQLTFDVAYARYDAQYSDTLAVLISTDCGVTFSLLYVKGGTTLATAPDKTVSLFVPTASQWRTESINLNSYIGQGNVMISFRNIGWYGQSLYVDNINITGVTQTTYINSVAENLLKVFPNPSNGLFEIATGEALEEIDVEITDVLGRSLLTAKIPFNSKKEFDLRSYGKGLYFIKASSKPYSITKKMIVD